MAFRRVFERIVESVRSINCSRHDGRDQVAPRLTVNEWAYKVEMGCGICLKAPVMFLDRVTLLPCEHKFHYECLNSHIKSLEGPQMRNCPVCRMDLARGESEFAAFWQLVLAMREVNTTWGYEI
jgi:hypothetical protein